MPSPLKISYPRKCHHCEYVSNNPQMWHYHGKTHDPIPEGTKCWHGCESPALFRGTGGKYTCCKKSVECPEFSRRQSERTRAQWVGDTERKEATKIDIISRLHNQETVNKQIITKRQRFGTLDPVKAKDYRHYARYVRERAQNWATSQGYTLGKQTFHVDHILSISDAWNAGLSEEIVNHPVNLRVIEARLNSSKGAKSLITVDELLELIKSYGP